LPWYHVAILSEAATTTRRFYHPTKNWNGCDYPITTGLVDYRLTAQSGGSFESDTRMNYSSEHFAFPCSDDRPRPISAGNLVSLIDLGWSDYRIAHHFGVEQSKVLGLRAYYGLVDSAERVEARTSA
jgi:hypothetical protein